MGRDAAAGGRRPSRRERGQRPAAARRADHARAPPHHRPGAGGRAGDGPMKPVGLTVNAIPVTEVVEPRMHLADLLREKLCLTGTHLRCEQGACGACTLLIDGHPARSCITYAVLCEGAEITSIEGLEDDPVMTALRRAFTAEHGLQCGFCTPGTLMTARDIVTRLPDAAERRIRLELTGHLCRSTAHAGIVRAIRRHGARDAPGAGGAPPRRSRRRRLGATQARAGRFAACRTGAKRGLRADRRRGGWREAGCISRNRLGIGWDAAEYRIPTILY